MVWGLFPADPLSGENKYYIFKKGLYRVGRKGCDVIINKDKGVSRVHAEITVDAMTDLTSFTNLSSDTSSKVRIKDCSKYGTFIKTNIGTKKKVHELPDKETTLKEGDLVSFGTGNATYRFSFVPLVFFVCCSEPFRVNHSVYEAVTSIGARGAQVLSQECTHILLDQNMPLKEDLIDAIVAKKSFVLTSWLEIVAEQNIRSEIPNCSNYIPSVTVEGASVKVVDPKTRENCLEGYTFLLESAYKYRFGDRLQSLLNACGAKTLSIEEFCSSSQESQYGENNRVVYVIPRGSVDKFVLLNKLNSVSRLIEMDLICAVLSGDLAPSKLILPAVVISSSCSTDDTVVADSDVEADAETSAPVLETRAINNEEAHTYVAKETVSINPVCTRLEDGHAMSAKEAYIGEGARKCTVDEPEPRSPLNHDVVTVRRSKVDEPECGSSDILFIQDLIAKDVSVISKVKLRGNNGVVNFKCFRKMNTPSGNSFTNLIPFARYPYKDSDYGNEEVVESVKEEKKRKQMEAIAEDLFNSEKARKRGSAGTLHAILTRKKQRI